MFVTRGASVAAPNKNAVADSEAGSNQDNHLNSCKRRGRPRSLRHVVGRNHVRMGISSNVVTAIGSDNSSVKLVIGNFRIAARVCLQEGSMRSAKRHGDTR